MKLTALHLKSAIMSYYRFNKHNIVATEVAYSSLGGQADVLIDTGKEHIEVEVKVDRSDMRFLEKQKKKHVATLGPGLESKFLPNRFFICVPEQLEEVAMEFILNTNPLYGLIIYTPDETKAPKDSLVIKKKAGKIHNLYTEKISETIIMRLVSDLCNMYEEKVKNLCQE